MSPPSSSAVGGVGGSDGLDPVGAVDGAGGVEGGDPGLGGAWRDDGGGRLDPPARTHRSCAGSRDAGDAERGTGGWTKRKSEA